MTEGPQPHAERPSGSSAPLPPPPAPRSDAGIPPPPPPPPDDPGGTDRSGPADGPDPSEETSSRAKRPAGASDAGDRGSSRGRAVLHTIRETVQLVVVALVLAFIIKSLALQAFFIPSGSMLQTLQIGDRVLVEKISYHFREPERGEIIVFRRPGHEDEGFSVAATARSFLEGIGLSEPDEDRDLIKRIIGLPGETIELRDGVVHVNGQPLTEDYTAPEARDFPPIEVPAGHYYVLGDNRGNSLDSRFTLGTIPEDNIIGRAFAIIWPFGDATLSMDEDYPNVGEDPLGSSG